MDGIAVILQEANTCFWENDCPLEWCAMEPLTLPAVAMLRVEGVARKSKTHHTAPARGLVLRLEEFLAIRTTRWHPVVGRLRHPVFLIVTTVRRGDGRRTTPTSVGNGLLVRGVVLLGVIFG